MCNSGEVHVTSNESVPAAHECGYCSGCVNFEEDRTDDTRLDRLSEVVKESRIGTVFQPIALLEDGAAVFPGLFSVRYAS